MTPSVITGDLRSCDYVWNLGFPFIVFSKDWVVAQEIRVALFSPLPACPKDAGSFHSVGRAAPLVWRAPRGHRLPPTADASALSDLCEEEEFKVLLLELKHKHDVIMKSQLRHKSSLSRRTSSTGSRG